MNLPPSLQTVFDRLTVTRDFVLPGGLIYSPNLLQAIIMIFLVFLLVVLFASFRRHYMHWSIKGILPGVTFGFALALIIEGFLLIGGRTVLTETLGWKSAPKPLSNALSAGRSKLITVLGVTDEIPTSNAASGTSLRSVMSNIDDLTPEEQDELYSRVCK